jgi:hypothetical protein
MKVIVVGGVIAKVFLLFVRLPCFSKLVRNNFCKKPSNRIGMEFNTAIFQ